MVDIKVGGPGALKGPDKKKPAQRTGAAGGPSFASLLDAAGEAEETSAPLQAGLTGTLAPLVGDDEQLPPRSGKQQAKDLMAGLSELADDVLAGNPTGAAKKLEAYLSAEVADKATLSDEAKALLDEISTRAAVAAAKVKV